MKRSKAKFKINLITVVSSSAQELKAADKWRCNEANVALGCLWTGFHSQKRTREDENTVKKKNKKAEKQETASRRTQLTVRDMLRWGW